jgi:hypothetical protein
MPNSWTKARRVVNCGCRTISKGYRVAGGDKSRAIAHGEPVRRDLEKRGLQAAHKPAITRSETEIRRPFSRAIEDQQLVLDEHGFGHHGAGAGTSEPAHRRQQMKKQDGQIAQRTILTRSRHAKMLTNFGIRHAQAHAVRSPTGMRGFARRLTSW